ncbi:MAG: hypothetical protein OEV73_00245 [Desulfobulbaceae bacterium]|nr:hypothetical protein [Desulfobulbaceae bacterium]
MAIKHFNAGNVWGRTKELERKSTQNGAPYLMVTLDCSGKHGSVRAYGRIFGAEKIDGLIDHHGDHPDQVVRMRGYFGQYEAREEIMSNFTFYGWEPAPDQPPRAAFVLVGKVTDLAQIGDKWRLSLHLSRPGQAGHDAQEEDFDVWALDGQLVAGMLRDMVVEVKGYMQQGHGEDEYGASTGEVRPIIHRSRIVEGF